MICARPKKVKPWNRIRRRTGLETGVSEEDRRWNRNVSK